MKFKFTCHHCNKSYTVYGPSRSASKYCSSKCQRTVAVELMVNARIERLRANRTNTPEPPTSDSAYIALTRGKYALVDADMVVPLSKRLWSVHRGVRGGDYACSNRTLMHRLIAGATNGLLVDHINGDTLDNRRANLRLVDAAQNARNTKTTAVSGYKGVTKTPQGRWAARIAPYRIQVNIGNFETAEEAAYAYDQFAMALYGEYCRLNFEY